MGPSDDRLDSFLKLIEAGISEAEICERLNLSEDEYLEICASAPTDGPTPAAALLLEYARRRRAEVAARVAEARFRALMDISPNAILVVNGMTGEILLANSACGPVFGYSPGELVGQKVEMLVEQNLEQVHVSYRRGFLSSARKRLMGYHPQIFARTKSGARIEMAIALTTTSGSDEVMAVCAPREAVVDQELGTGFASHSG